MLPSEARGGGRRKHARAGSLTMWTVAAAALVGIAVLIIFYRRQQGKKLPPGKMQPILLGKLKSLADAVQAGQ